MNGLTRVVATLAGAAGAGALLWLAAQLGRHTNGSYWAAYGIVAVAGLVFALVQLRGRNGSPRGMFVFGFLPVLVVAGWVLVAMQPHGSWFHDHVLSWSGDIGVRGVVRDVGTWVGVLAFGIGYTLGLTLEPAPRRREEVVAPATFDRTAADEPVTAERNEVGYPTREPVADEAPTTTSTTAPTTTTTTTAS